MLEREQPKPEQVEAKVEVPAAKPERPEAPRIDTRYSNEVSRYFNAAREVAKIGEEHSFELFLAEQQRSLEKLVDPRLAEKMSPSEVSFALSELAGRMASDNPNNPENLTGDPAQDAQREKQYLEAKKIFMDSSAKIFPDVKADLSDLSTFKNATERIKSTTDAIVPEISITESKRLLQENPKELAKRMADVLHAGTKMSSDAWLAYTDPKERESGETRLATAAEALYKIQLMRDELQQEMYGRADVPPSDARRIDAIREEIKGPSPEGEKPKIKFYASEFGVYSPEAAKGLQERLEGLTVAKVGETARNIADFLKARSETYTSNALARGSLVEKEGKMRALGNSLEAGKPTEKQLLAALKEVDYQYHISEHLPDLKEKRPELDSMRHFLRNELQKMREAKVPETKEEEPTLKALKEKAGRAMSYLQERGMKIHLATLRFEENDVDRWRKVADGLDKIRSTFLKDKDPSFKKVPKYQPEVDKLFESLKR